MTSEKELKAFMKKFKKFLIENPDKTITEVMWYLARGSQYSFSFVPDKHIMDNLDRLVERGYLE